MENDVANVYPGGFSVSWIPDRVFQSQTICIIGASELELLYHLLQLGWGGLAGGWSLVHPLNMFPGLIRLALDDEELD